MASYEKGLNIDRSTMFYGASEAPRVHGLTGKVYTSSPRFKNHYFVSFQYSDLAEPAGINATGLPGITHRVKSIDAPRFDIETETLNQYNKPRIVPTKINYNPITITFWDDRSNEVTNFWKQIYEFYFHNGRRMNENMYAVRDSNITTTLTGNSDRKPAYDDYGYYIGNKNEKMNLFQHMSLYLVANQQCHRIDLINPYLQSMQHDQFSQEMSSELAQNTATWGYENVVYYGRNAIKDEEALMGVIGGVNTSSVFYWDNPTYHERPAQETGHNTPALRYPYEENRFSGTVIEESQVTRIDPNGALISDKSPVGPSPAPRPVSTLDEHLFQLARAGSVPDTNTHPGTHPDVEGFTSMPDRAAQLAKEQAIANAVDNFSDFPAATTAETGFDAIATASDASAPAAGTNNRPTVDKIFIGPNGAPNVAFRGHKPILVDPPSSIGSAPGDDPTGVR